MARILRLSVAVIASCALVAEVRWLVGEFGGLSRCVDFGLCATILAAGLAVAASGHSVWR